MSRRMLLAGAAVCLLAGVADAAYAQAAASADVSEVIVTARKRAEAEISVPVVITALSAEAMAKAGATDIYKISQMVPQLIISQGPSSSAGIIALRGINSGTGVSTDQTVALNLDGITVNNAMALRIGQFDLRQVEVLKGPQSLFFGKNSPAGVISFSSEGPGSRWGGYAKTGYEVTADEWRSEAAFGGPVNDKWGVRVAGYYGTMKGYFRNPLPENYAPGLVFGPHSSRVPNRDEWGGRVTLVYQPVDEFTATLKAAVAVMKGTSANNEQQRISCPLGVHGGVEQVPGRPFSECKINRTTNPLGVVSPAVAALDPAFRGEDFDHNKQYVNVLNLDYRFDEHFTLTSITGYYESQYWGLNLNAGPVSNVVTSLPIDRRELSQEVRLASNLDGRINFTVGAYYQDAFLYYSPYIYRGPGAPGAALVIFDTSRYTFRGDTKSVFGQITFKLTDQIELSGGARYTDEEKRQTARSRSGVDTTPFLIPSKQSVSDLSPEVTLSYQPSDDLNVFASYREGFKSGGFVAATTAIYTAPTTNAFGPENIKGGEVGLKARLLDRSLRVNAAAYNYEIKGLQVSALDPIRGSIFTQNAASAKIRGLEADFSYRPPTVEGLSISGAAGYNHARYGKFVATCYTGQTISKGCNLLQLGPRFTSQDLGGTPLTFAPDWSGNLNMLYEFTVTSDLRGEVGGGVRYNGSYFAAGDHTPESRARPVTFFDAQARLISAKGNWELALIGRNLGNELRPLVAADVAFSGTTSGLATGTRGDVQAFVNRPREVWVQLTIRR